MADAVNSPSHYKRDGVPFECIDVIKAALTPEEFLGFLRGNVLKYQYRARHKHATPEGFAEDVRKAKWYNDRLAEALAERSAGGTGSGGPVRGADPSNGPDILNFPINNAPAKHQPKLSPEERKLVDDAFEKQVAEELGVPLDAPIDDRPRCQCGRFTSVGCPNLARHNPDNDAEHPTLCKSYPTDHGMGPCLFALGAPSKPVAKPKPKPKPAAESGVRTVGPSPAACPLGRPAGNFTGCPKALISVRPVDRGNPDGGNQMALVCTETDLPCPNAT